MDSKQDLQGLRKAVRDLEKRVARLEAGAAPATGTEAAHSDSIVISTVQDADSMEFQIGQVWFARAGIVAVAIGIAFLMTFPFPKLPAITPTIFGYLMVVVCLWLARRWEQNYAHLSRYLIGGGLILGYFATLRLYYFAENTVLNSLTLEYALLTLTIILGMWLAVRRSSPFLTVIAFLLAYMTAILSENAEYLFIMNLALAGWGSWLYIKRRWSGIYIFAIFCSYFIHLVWMIGSPVLGNKPELITQPAYYPYVIMGYMLAFAAGVLWRPDREQEDYYLIVGMVLNGLGGYGLFAAAAYLATNAYFSIMQLLASAIFLSLAIAFWIRERSRYSTFIFSMMGYMALSLSLLFYFEVHDALILLSWQSLLVISTALWFESVFIVRANTLIYLFIGFVYMSYHQQIGWVDLSYPAVAMISARVLNWQKERLQIRSDILRTSYLVAVWVLFPFTIYYIVPHPYVSLSWIGITLFYYGVSLILNNKKYRWMALLTLLLTIIYVFLVDLVELRAEIRIISFLILGLVLITISILYSRAKKKKES